MAVQFGDSTVDAHVSCSTIEESVEFGLNRREGGDLGGRTNKSAEDFVGGTLRVPQGLAEVMKVPWKQK